MTPSTLGFQTLSVALQVVPVPLASSHDLHLLVRGIHLLAVAILVGGAVLTWLVLSRTDGRRGSAENALSVATAYEWLFWGAVGVAVATGVGNLGALAPGVPGPGTAWGTTFAVKLLVVVGLLAFSAARTVLLRLVASAYAITAGALAVALALAEVLAHG